MWIIIGITLLLVVVLEMSCRLFYLSVDKLFITSPLKMRRCIVDGHVNTKWQKWQKQYSREFQESFNMRWEPYVYWRRLAYCGKYINVNNEGIRGCASESKCTLDDEKKEKLKIFA